MKKTLLNLLLFISNILYAQQPYLESSLIALQKNDQFKHAIISFYAIDASSGKVMVSYNKDYGLAPASCQKIITSISAFEMLGKDFHFHTKFTVKDHELFIEGGGDPTLGSDRWSSTNATSVIHKIRSRINQVNQGEKIKNIFIDDLCCGYQPIPDGWIWQDIGNYYGAGAWSLNWKENLYEVKLRSPDHLNKPVEIVSTNPTYFKDKITTFITTASANSGDNAWIYAAPYSNKIFATGTIPVSQNNFTIKGAMPEPALIFAKEITEKLHAESFQLQSENLRQKKLRIAFPAMSDSISSPSLDSINYWFLKKSINLFGEALVKAIGIRVGDASTTSGIEAMYNYWIKKIDNSAMNIIDGSGLSPANRVSTKLLVDFLQYARIQSWYPLFYNALPEMNGIKMKDGYISGVRSYTGIIKQKTGKEVIFAFIVNNFTGSPSAAREQMWRILDQLKSNSSPK